MGILELIAAVKDAFNDAVAGKRVSAWKKTLPLQQFCIDTLEGFGFQSTGAMLFASATDAEKDELRAALGDLSAAFDNMPVMANGVDAEGRIFPGDGSFLKVVVDLLIKLLPYIL